MTLAFIVTLACTRAATGAGNHPRDAGTCHESERAGVCALIDAPVLRRPAVDRRSYDPSASLFAGAFAL